MLMMFFYISNFVYCIILIKLHKIYLHFESILDLGKIKVVTPFGNSVYAYNLERTVCDIINNRINIDIEIANKAIRNCIKSKEFNANKMFEYAKK